MKRSLIVVLLLLVAVSGFSAGDEKSNGNNFDYGYSYLGCTVNNMPYEIRHIRIHEDDIARTSEYSTIDETRYRMDHGFNLGIMLAREITFPWHNRPCINVGVGLDWIIFPLFGIGGGQEENTYQGEGRDVGSALTYVYIRQNGIIPSLGNAFTDFFFNFTPRVKLEFAPLGDICNQFWLGTSISYYSLNAQNGWDRYSSHEQKKEYKFANVFPIRVYGTWFFDDNTDFGLTVGVQYQPSSVVGLGKEADVEIGQGYYLGLTRKF